MIFKLTERDLRTHFGTFREILFYDGQRESIALVVGDVRGDDVLCRVHSACISGHVFASAECECRAEMETAQRLIEEAGRGVIVYLDQEGKGNGHLALMASIPFKLAGLKQGEAYERAGFEKDARSFRPAAEILQELGVGSVVLLTDNEGKADELRNAGIAVNAVRPLR